MPPIIFYPYFSNNFQQPNPSPSHHWTVCLDKLDNQPWAGVDSVWEQKKLEVRKLPENRPDSHLSGARFVTRM
jgi:hypothetical protein